MGRPREYKVYGAEMEITLFGQSFTTVFEIRCPRCQNSYTWQKSPGERKHSKNPPRYQCIYCDKFFYPHTSAMFKQITVSEETGKEIETIDRFDLFYDLCTTSKTLDDLEKQYGISSSSLSGLRSWIYGKVREDKKNLWETYGKKFPRKGYIVVIYMDSMVIKVQGNKFALILAVNRELNILGFEFAEKEEASAVKRVFKQALLLKGLDIKEFQNKSSETPRLILITDGHGCYRKMIREN